MTLTQLDAVIEKGVDYVQDKMGITLKPEHEATKEDYDIAWWHLDGTCANCGNLLTIPCPVDNPDGPQTNEY